MILEYCNSDIYFDIYHLKENQKKTCERFSLVVVVFCFVFFRHQTSLHFATVSKCLTSDRGKTKTKKKRNGKIRLEFKKERGGEVR